MSAMTWKVEIGAAALLALLGLDKKANDGWTLSWTVRVGAELVRAVPADIVAGVPARCTRSERHHPHLRTNPSRGIAHSGRLHELLHQRRLTVPNWSSE